MSCPSTRLFTLTVFSGTTEPSPLRYTPMSPVLAAATKTGRGRAPLGGWLAREGSSPDFARRAYPPRARRQAADSPSNHRFRVVANRIDSGMQSFLSELSPLVRCCYYGSTSFFFAAR